MYIDQGEVVRVRVEADDFFDDEPGPPKMADGVRVQREAKRAPYNVIVSVMVHSGFEMVLSVLIVRHSVQ
jgi:DNA-directed RNA polymerase III subunit RPC8